MLFNSIYKFALYSKNEDATGCSAFSLGVQRKTGFSSAKKSFNFNILESVLVFRVLKIETVFAMEYMYSVSEIRINWHYTPFNDLILSNFASSSMEGRAYDRCTKTYVSLVNLQYLETVLSSFSMGFGALV